MVEVIKYLEIHCKSKLDKIYYLYKTSSSEINLEILSQLQKYESSLDFFSYYTKNDLKNIINSVNQLDKNFSSIFNDNSSNFISNTDKYISQISKIILILNLILRNQEIINKLLIKSKKYLNEISINCKIENIYKEKLLSLINYLEYNFNADISSYNNNLSLISTEENSCRSINLFNKNSKKQIQINDSKIQDEFFNEKKFSNVNEEILSDIETPEFFEKNSNKENINLSSNDFNNSVSNDNDFNISLRDMVFNIADSKDDENSSKGKKSKRKKGKFDKINILPQGNKNSKDKNIMIKSRLLQFKLLGKEGQIKMYRDLLLLIKKLYKLCLITAEERIEIKKLIISKSKKIIDFYIKEYDTIKQNYLKSANTIKKLL